MSEYSPTGSVGYRNRELLRAELNKNPMCICGHRRIDHFVGGGISDCDECACERFVEKETEGASENGMD